MGKRLWSSVPSQLVNSHPACIVSPDKPHCHIITLTHWLWLFPRPPKKDKFRLSTLFQSSCDSDGVTFIFDDIELPNIYLRKFLGLKTKKLPSCAKKGSKEENSFCGVVLVGVATLEWPVIDLLKNTQKEKALKCVFYLVSLIEWRGGDGVSLYLVNH